MVHISENVESLTGKKRPSRQIDAGKYVKCGPGADRPDCFSDCPEISHSCPKTESQSQAVRFDKN